MGAAEVTRFLSHLAEHQNVSASTQNQALAAILFLYKKVLHVRLPWLDEVVRAKRGKRLPVVLTRVEVAQVLAKLDTLPRLMVLLLYGAGLRLLECLRLRMKDIDFARSEITVREGKGDRDRVTMLPRTAHQMLRDQMARTKLLFDHDLARGGPGVSLPDALARKYPQAAREWPWWYVFPARDCSVDPRSGAWLRHHVHESFLQRAVRDAVLKAKIAKPASCHTFRHALVPSFTSSCAIRQRSLRTVRCEESARPLRGRVRITELFVAPPRRSLR